MIIIYKPGNGDTVDPIVIIDYTRSDEQYSEAQIMRYVSSLGVQAAKGKGINTANLKIYSLDYACSFTHSGINYGDAIKTKFQATIENAPMSLVGALNIKQYISEENINSLSNASRSIIDPEVFFPTGAMVIKTNSNSTDTITRTFMLYSTPFNFDSRRLNSSLILQGADYDSMVIRLQFAVSLKKNTPLVSQLSTILSGQGYTVNSDDSLTSTFPVVERYYPPAPINAVISEVCRDNNLAYRINSDEKTIYIKSLSPSDKPDRYGNGMCFNGYVTGAKIMSSFSLQNYASCTFEAEAFDAELFESLTVYDDSMTEGQFANLRQMPGVYMAGSVPVKKYRFYVLEYTYTDNRYKTSVTIRGTNNWLINNFKLDSFLENKIYTGGV